MDIQIHTASTFLSMPTRRGLERYYLYEIKSLDLQTTVPSNLNSNVNCVSQYLDVCCKEKQLFAFEEEEYQDFSNICLEYFQEKFEYCLFKELENKTGENSAMDLDFFDRLRRVEPDADTEVILYRYILVHIRTERNVYEDIVVELFETIANILFTKNYNNPHLSAALIKAVSYNGCLPSYVLSATNPSNRLDYVLHHMKAYCIEKQYIDVFRAFKRKNSIVDCVKAGRKDLLEILFKYGSWKDFSTTNIYSWMYHCFGITLSKESLDVVQFLTQHRYDLKRFLLILQLYYAFLLPVKKQSRYLSTIQLLWRSIPYHYLPAMEMQTVLTLTTSPEKHAKVRRACELYYQILCPGKLEPRSLKHYARCAIRSILDQKALLPEGIGCLDVPEICRSYLRLEY